MLCNATIRFSDSTRLTVTFDDSEVVSETEIGKVEVVEDGEPTIYRLVMMTDA